MPRKTIKQSIVDSIYVNACFKLIDLGTSDESDADEIEIEVYRDITVVTCNFLGLTRFTYLNNNRSKDSDTVTLCLYQNSQLGSMKSYLPTMKDVLEKSQD